MKEIKEKKQRLTEQIEYKYISDDGKFTSKFRYDVEEYEKKQGEPYFKEYLKKLKELKEYSDKNKQYLEHFKDYKGTLEELVLYLLLRDNNAKDCYVDTYSSGGDSWKEGDF